MIRVSAFLLLLLCLCAPAFADPLPRHDMVEAADPRAAEIGREILRQGGSAIDAAVAIAIALTLVEPQSAGIGGGAFLVYWSAKEQRATSFDGRETAPAAARPDRFMGADGKPLAFYSAVVGGRSIGVPGLLRMLALAHSRYGKLPWSQLVLPTARLAEAGITISPRLHGELAADRFLNGNAPARALYYAPDGTALPAGTMITNIALAATLRDIADSGAEAFYQGPIAQDVVDAIHAATPPGDMTVADLADYRAKERLPVCGTYHEHRICGMGPPSSGAVTTIELLKLLEPFDLRRHANDVEAWHLFAEASRLAYADRARYLADTDFVPAPVAGLIDPHYDLARAKLIDPDRAHQGPAEPGDPPGRRADNWRDGVAPELPSTSTLSVIDGAGDAVALTASIENTFGARVMVRGFLLNNELTDFSFVPEVDGKPVANRVEPGKRPLSAMAPSLVFAPDGKLELVVGSAGGAPIIADVAKTILAVVDWDMTLPDALALTNVSNRNGATEIEAGPAAQPLAAALAARGHQMRVWQRESGLGGIRVTKDGYDGAVDPRREGAALGD